jgi:hypothetical protein
MHNSSRINDFAQPSVIDDKESRDFRIVVFLSLIHVPLGVLIYNVGSLALLHPFGVFALGLYWAIQKRVKIERTALAIAYIIGAEVLWRMAGVSVFWEFGKYGSAVIAIVALVRRKHYTIPNLPILYLAALLPACLITLTEFDLSSARSNLSSIMSGPFLLLICCWFFSKVRMNSLQLRQLFFAIIVPLFSVASATLFYTVTMEDIQFSGESNFATSGGFGPNQVSSMLGLGAFAALSCLIVFQNSIKYRIYFMLAAIFFSAQSVMTFSRGGIYNAVGAILIVALLEFRSPTKAAKRIVPVGIMIILFVALVFPFLNDFTGGSLQERFEDTGTSQRSDIAEADLQIFLENPVFGVGVGSAYELRKQFLDHKAMSHTEFARLISEHGMFGILAIFSLIAMLIINFGRQRSVLGRAVVAGVAVWSILFMLNAGMRMAAPSFMWGMIFVNLYSPSKPRGRTVISQLRPKRRPARNKFPLNNAELVEEI